MLKLLLYQLRVNNSTKVVRTIKSLTERKYIFVFIWFAIKEFIFKNVITFAVVGFYILLLMLLRKPILFYLFAYYSIYSTLPITVSFILYISSVFIFFNYLFSLSFNIYFQPIVCFTFIMWHIWPTFHVSLLYLSRK